jgi:protein-arginine kinase activator protein McsA
LRRKLERAVETEDFERAAELRDQIRALEPVL